jgi:hypothetical protein
MGEKRHRIFPHLYLRIGFHGAGGKDRDGKQLST